MGGSLTNATLNVNSVRGASDPDDFDIFPGIQHKYLSGSLEEQIKGFRRNITIDFGVQANFADRKAILDFLLDPNRQLVPLVTSPTGLAASPVAGGTLNPLTTYYYKVSAVDAFGESLASTEVAQGTSTLSLSIQLVWNAVPNANLYKVFRTQTSGSYTSPSLCGYAQTNSFLDNGVGLISGAPFGGAEPTAISVALAEPEQFANEWLDGFSLGRQFVLHLKEKTINTAPFPV